MRTLAVIPALLWAAALFAGIQENKSPEERLAGLEGKEKIQQLILLLKENVLKEPRKAVKYGEQAQQLLKKNKDSIPIKLFENLAWAYAKIRNSKKALQYSNESLKLAKKSGQKKMIASSLTTQGFAHFSNNQFNSALEKYKEALTIAETLGSETRDARTLTARIHYNMGNAYIRLSRYTRAVECLFKSLGIYEQSGDKAALAYNFNSLGVVYMELNDFQQSLKYQLKALDMMEKVGDKRGICTLNINLGTLYLQVAKPRASLDYFNKALAMLDLQGNQQMLSIVLNNAGIVYQRLKRFDKAMAYHQKALKIVKALDDGIGLATTLGHIGNLYKRKMQFNTALEFMKKATLIAEKLDAEALTASCYEQLTYIYSAQTEFEKANEYEQKCDELNNKIASENTKNKIIEMQTKYETHKKEREIELLKKEKIIDELELSKQQYWRSAMYAGFVVLAGFILLLINRYRLKVRVNTEIREKNEQLKEANRELKKAHEEIEELGGLLPICSKCKRIRDDEGYWHQVEEFFCDHSEVDFTHGICPNCLKKYYPDV